MGRTPNFTNWVQSTNKMLNTFIAPAGFNAFAGQPAAPASSSGFDIFASSQPQQQLPAQQQHQQFGGFDAFASNPQQQSAGSFNAFASGGVAQQQQAQSQSFNAFGTQQQQPQQQNAGGFSPFGTSPPRPQQQGGFNAFASTQTQQVDPKQGSFAAFGNPPVAAPPASSNFDAFGSFTSPSGKA